MQERSNPETRWATTSFVGLPGIDFFCVKSSFGSAPKQSETLFLVLKNLRLFIIGKIGVIGVIVFFKISKNPIFG
jgi:hypothetical protein